MVGIINKQIKRNIPDFKPGDEVIVEIKTGPDKQRIQTFQGLVIAESGKGINRTFTVRKYSFGIGVEKIFPMYSPMITEVKVVRPGKVRRAKLYYLRGLKGKKAVKVKSR
mgnify:CR=1 FL=1